MSFENSVDLFNIFRTADSFNTTGDTINKEEQFEFDLFDHCHGISSNTSNSDNEYKIFDIKVLFSPKNKMIVIPHCKILIYN